MQFVIIDNTDDFHSSFYNNNEYYAPSPGKPFLHLQIKAGSVYMWESLPLPAYHSEVDNLPRTHGIDDLLAL